MRRPRAELDLLADPPQPLRQALAEVAGAAHDSDHPIASRSPRPTSARRSGETITVSQTTAPGIASASAASSRSSTKTSRRGRRRARAIPRRSARARGSPSSRRAGRAAPSRRRAARSRRRASRAAPPRSRARRGSAGSRRRVRRRDEDDVGLRDRLDDSRCRPRVLGALVANAVDRSACRRRTNHSWKSSSPSAVWIFVRRRSSVAGRRRTPTSERLASFRGHRRRAARRPSGAACARMWRPMSGRRA